MLKSGDRAPNVAGVDFAAGPVLLAFFKVSCPTCQFTFPFLQRLAGAGVSLVGISQDNAAATEAFREKYGLQFPILLDPAADGYPASNAYKITHVPSLFLVTPEGTIAQTSEGFSRSDLEDLGGRIGFVLFSAEEAVPVFRPG